MLPGQASGQDGNTNDYDFCEPNADGAMLYYRYVDQSYCEVVASPEKYTGVIDIPSHVTEQHIPVVGVGIYAFSFCDGLTEVHLPYTMLYLESASFYSSKDLQRVVLNDHLVAIGWNAFEGCSELSSVNIPQSLEYVGYEAFYNCPKMLTPLYNDKYFFYYPMMNYESEGKTYVIPDGIEVIGDGAFIFTYLHEVVTPNTLKIISDYAFDGSHVHRVNIPASVDSIGKHAFGQSNLEEVVVPASVKHFGQHVFYSGFCLKKAVLEAPLDSIPQGTFANCFELTDVSYPVSVHKLGDYSFSQCVSLDHLPDLSNIDTLGISVFNRLESLESVSLPVSVTYIPDNTFAMCSNVKEVTLHDGIERIGRSAFYQLSSLESIQIPASVRSIGASAFSYCKNLKSIALSEGLLSIGDDAFSQLGELKSITLPKSLESIGWNAFAYGFKLKDVYVKWDDPLVLSNDIFDSYQHTLGMTLHVPAGTAERYAHAPYWANFKDISDDVSAISTTTSDNHLKPKSIKRLVDGKICIDSHSFGLLSTDGRKVQK